ELHRLGRLPALAEPKLPSGLRTGIEDVGVVEPLRAGEADDLADDMRFRCSIRPRTSRRSTSPSVPRDFRAANNSRVKTPPPPCLLTAVVPCSEATIRNWRHALSACPDPNVA